MARHSWLAAAVVVASCGSGATGDPNAPSPLEGPVSIQCKVGRKDAVVTLTFSKSAENVEVKVRGLDGLAVTSDPRPVSGRAYSRGQQEEIRVEYVPGAGMSSVSVQVVGVFASKRKSVVGGCVVGELSDEQRRERLEGVKRDGRGEWIYDMRAPAKDRSAPSTGADKR